MRRRYLRSAVLGLAFVTSLPGLCVSALAYMQPSSAENAAIARAAKAAWSRESPRSCPVGLGGPRVFHMDSAQIASTYPQWGYAKVKDDGCTYTIGYLLKRPSLRSNQWSVVARQLDNPQDCSTFHAPKPILYEFSIVGVHNNEGQPQPCAKPTGKPWCGQFGDYAVNTSCAVDDQVAKLYDEECVPAGGDVNSTLPPCGRTLLAFKCQPGGNAYEIVNCVDGQRRLGFRLAE